LSESTEVKGAPAEELRPQVPQMFLDGTTGCMQESVNGRSTDLVLNLDEVRIYEREDRK
jgi:hypothetical protein